ncbi:hypothetical protein [Methylobacterium soli]|nr:hypothetical protein [Methylobacterium soli]GJE42062.1 hypothetical protein AEGHOMDF_1233 [Methylobacterium soli]
MAPYLRAVIAVALVAVILALLATYLRTGPMKSTLEDPPAKTGTP